MKRVRNQRLIHRLAAQMGIALLAMHDSNVPVMLQNRPEP